MHQSSRMIHLFEADFHIFPQTHVGLTSYAQGGRQQTIRGSAIRFQSTKVRLGPLDDETPHL